MKPIAIHADAETEVREGIAYYEARRPGLGRKFRLSFEAVVDLIRGCPEAAAVLDARGTRKQRFQGFPYTVYYVDMEDSLWIAAVAHQKRRPGYWSDRDPEVDPR